jgi:polar amino acid transport system permease protein
MNIDLLERYGPRLLEGFLVTVELVAISIVCGMILACGLTYLRLGGNRFLRKFALFYGLFFRGTPLIAQVFLFYYGLGQFSDTWRTLGLWWFFREPFYCVALTFTLNTAGYQAEIFRGAVEAVARGQWEGAAALGLSKRIALLRVVLPQAAMYALRPFGNEIILMIKASAIVAIITVYDLMGETRRAYAQTFDFQTYIWAGLIYLTIVEALRHFVDWVERRITIHLKR